MTFARSLVPLYVDSDRNGQKMELVKLVSLGQSQLGDDDELSQFESGCDNQLAELGQVVLVSVTNLFEDAVEAQAFEQSGHLAAVLVGQIAA